VSVKNILGWLAVSFIVWWVITQPGDAQHVVTNIGHWLTGAVSGLSNFFSSI
jgi:hypothetical protein